MRPWVWRTWPRWPTWRPTSTPSSGTIRTTSCEENTSNQYRGCLHLWFELSSFLPAQCAQFQTIHREPSDFVSKLMEHPESDVKVIFMINLAVGTGDPRTAAGYLLTWPFSSASPFLGNKMRNDPLIFRYFYHYTSVKVLHVLGQADCDGHPPRLLPVLSQPLHLQEDQVLLYK